MRHESTRLVLTTACALVAIVFVGLSSSAGASEISARQSDGTGSNKPGELTATAATIPADVTAFRAVTPCRLLDTRLDRTQPIQGGETVRVRIEGRCGASGETTAAVLSLTITESEGPGYVTTFPAGASRPQTSNLNYLANGTIANSAIAPLSEDGAIDIFVYRTAHLVVDITGVFVPVSDRVSAGRFVPTTPARLLDTRETGQRAAGNVDVPLPPGVPSDATAVVTNVTIVDADSPGYITVHAGGGPRPLASSQNADALDRTRAVTVIAPVSSSGFQVYRSMVSDIVVDVSGWFTGPAAAADSAGLFQPQAPTRIRDSRTTHDPLHRGGTIDVGATDTGGSSGASAIAANLTSVDAVGPGFITAHPARTPRPIVSNLNPRWRAPIANLALLPRSAQGIWLYGHSGSHIVVDVVGHFLGDPVAVNSTTGAPVNEMPAAGGRVLFISDSAFAGIRWSKQLDMLQGATFTADLQSCRRLIGFSCRGREGYAPSTAVDAIRSAAGHYDTLIVTAGYNDYASTFEGAVHEVLSAARAKGIHRIVWLTYREDVGYVSPYGASWAGTFVTNNATLRAIVASGAAPEIEIAEWHETTAGAPRDWFSGDGLHLTGAGASAAATYISRKLAHLERRPCPAGLGGITTPGGWCADPDLEIQFDLPPGQ